MTLLVDFKDPIHWTDFHKAHAPSIIFIKCCHLKLTYLVDKFFWGKFAEQVAIYSAYNEWRHTIQMTTVMRYTD